MTDQPQTALADRGPAFPGKTVMQHVPGMSLRDWFAGQALNGAISSRDQWSALRADRGAAGPGEYVAAFAYALADARLKARMLEHEANGGTL